MQNKLEWFHYSGQTTNELIALEGLYRTDSLVCAFETGLYKKYDLYNTRTDISKLPPEELAILAVESLEREVNNGGYQQFFGNSSSQYAAIIIESLKVIGCLDTAKITQDALTVLGVSLTPSAAEIDEALLKGITDEQEDEQGKALDNCDKRYYDRAEDIGSALFTYIKSNKDRIALP